LGGLFGISSELVAAVLIAGFSLASIIVYVRGIRAGKSLPYLWAWLIRVALVALIFAAQLSEGATYSLALYGMQLFGATSIVVLIIKRQGKLGRIDGIDWFAIIAASGGLFAWAVSGNALYSVLGVILADATATGIGVRAALVYKRRESAMFWGLAFCAASLALLTVAGGPLVLVLAPLFSCINALVNIQMSWWVRRQQLRPQSALATAGEGV
jgi:hypothetical protein